MDPTTNPTTELQRLTDAILLLAPVAVVMLLLLVAPLFLKRGGPTDTIGDE